MQEQSDVRYVHALRFKWLTRLYDPLMAAAMREKSFRTKLVEGLQLQAGDRVLDVGCGTGTLMTMIKRANPDAAVEGLDGDPDILKIAQSKAAVDALDLRFHQGLCHERVSRLGTFNAVVSSLLFHHLNRDQKRRTLEQILSALNAGGELHIVDWGKPQNVVMRAAFLAVQALDGFETTNDSVRGILPDMLTETGFIDVQETTQMTTVFGTLSFYRAKAPMNAES